MIKELWTAIRLYIEDRLSSPLLTGFLFAWSIINYRFFLIVFGSEDFVTKVALIDAYVFVSEDARWIRGLLYPLGAALAYVLIYPFIDRFIFTVWRWHQHRLIQIRQRIDGERPISEKDRTQLLSQLYEVERKHEDEIRRLEVTIETQRARINELQAQPTSAPTDPIKPDDKTSSAEERRVLDQPVTLESLVSYVRRRFPTKPVGEDILSILLHDIDSTRYSKISDIDTAVNKAAPFVKRYEEQKPEFFTKGSDYLTKSLGLVDLDFRRRHAFSRETSDAFANHLDKSSDVLANEELTELEIKILEAVGDAERLAAVATEHRLQEQLAGDKVENKYHIDRLTKRKYLKSDYSSRQEDYVYELTHDGRRMLLALGKAGRRQDGTTGP